VEGVTEFRNTYLSHVQGLFGSHPFFIAALDKVSCSLLTLLSCLVF